MNTDRSLSARGLAWQPLTRLSAAELRVKAAEYRRMATTATTEQVRDALLQLARRFDALACQRERSHEMPHLMAKDPGRSDTR